MKAKYTCANDHVELSYGSEAPNHQSPRTKSLEHERSSNGNNPSDQNNSSYTFLGEIENLNVESLNDFPQEQRKIDPKTPKSLRPIFDENIESPTASPFHEMDDPLLGIDFFYLDPISIGSPTTPDQPPSSAIDVAIT
ncbi:hypothetical protein JCGZ_20829 [Jatropha curcas]|uniref:Uncharacterized protein n=1 Tax=Jatropha curcas TaxID=180498 RepID=A0A067JX16_JATCU|nr:hypothetical protein JCGZ_20829 [Jatropha curcas]